LTKSHCNLQIGVGTAADPESCHESASQTVFQPQNIIISVIQ